MENEKVYAMPFAKVYPLLTAKAIRKGRTQAEVNEVITWLTGYSIPQIKGKAIEKIKRTDKRGTKYG